MQNNLFYLIYISYVEQKNINQNPHLFLFSLISFNNCITLILFIHRINLTLFLFNVSLSLLPIVPLSLPWSSFRYRSLVIVPLLLLGHRSAIAPWSSFRYRSLIIVPLSLLGHCFAIASCHHSAIAHYSSFTSILLQDKS
jgi:hypothetical protein